MKHYNLIGYSDNYQGTVGLCINLKEMNKH